nr:Rossmann-like and DUF2520 domain-containing protein [Allomuricauda sp.]
MLNVIILGTGNLAQQLCHALSKVDMVQLVQVYGRNPNHLVWFETYTATTSDVKQIHDADIYLIAVKDTAIAEVSGHLQYKNGIVAHTSGATPMDVLCAQNRGVFYPVQTFTKGKMMHFDEIPICVEANNPQVLEKLTTLANSLSQTVCELHSEQRMQLHLAAVYTNNFTNLLYAIGEDICLRNNIPFELLYPLIDETAAKIKRMSPSEAQTGPARRGDSTSMDQHLKILSEPQQQEIYTLLSNAIKAKYEEKL